VARVADVIEQAVPGRAFTTMISQAVEVAKASGAGRTLFQTRYGVKHEVAEQYRQLAEEIVWRASHRDAVIAGTPPPASERSGDASTVVVMPLAPVPTAGPEPVAGDAAAGALDSADELPTAANE